MKTKKALYFYSELYKQEYYYLHKWTKQEVEAVFGPMQKFAGGVTMEINGQVIIWIEDINNGGISDLVHECIHAANFTLLSRGIKVNAKNDEAHAYLAQWIFEICFNKAKTVLKKF